MKKYLRVLTFVLFKVLTLSQIVPAMAKSIEIPDSDVAPLREFYEKKENHLIKELEGVRSILEQLKGIHIPSNPAQLQIDHKMPVGYSEKFTWFKKVQFIIKNYGGELTTSQIVEKLLEFEPAYKGENRKTAVASISAILSAKSKPGGFFGKKTNVADENVYFINEQGENDNLPF